MKNNELHGLMVPIITPVDDDDRVDEAAFRKLIRYLVDAGVHGLFVGGSAGEGPLLVMKEWVRMVEIALDENKGAVDLLGGAMDTSTKRVKDKIGVLRQVGYKNFAVAPTFYITLKVADEHLRLFGECREAGDGMEMVAYNIPSCTGSEISVETMCEMARRGWVRYSKDSSGKLDSFKRLVAEGKSLGLKAFMGEEAIMVDGLLAGACGIVPVSANYEPQTYIRAYDAAVSGDMAELMRMKERMAFLRQNLVMGGSSWIAALKYALSTKGIGNGRAVSPLQPLTAAEKKAIAEVK